MKRPGKDFLGEQRELAFVDEVPDNETPYERLLSDAIRGNAALFTREDAAH